MSTVPNYFKVLNLSTTTTDDAVSQAYSDLSKHVESEEQEQIIDAAYDLLYHESYRRVYKALLSTDEARELYHTIHAELNRDDDESDYALLAAAAKKLIAMLPEPPALLFYELYEYLEEVEQYDEALTALDRYLAQEAPFAARCDRAELLVEMKRTDEATKLFEELIPRAESYRPHIGLAEVLKEKGRKREAADVLDRAIAQQQNLSELSWIELLKTRAMLHFDADESTEGKAVLKRIATAADAIEEKNFVIAYMMKELAEEMEARGDTALMCLFEELHNKLDPIKEMEEKLAALEKAAGGGCFIATAVYGSYSHPQVIELRRFRDGFLQKSLLGRAFITTYYRLSPPIANRMKGSFVAERLVRPLLDLLVRAVR